MPMNAFFGIIGYSFKILFSIAFCKMKYTKINNVRKIAVFIMLLIAVSATAHTSYIIYNGENVMVQWDNLASKVDSRTPNPVRNGINSSSTCASIFRVSADSDNGGKIWSGGALLGSNSVYIDPGTYNCLSLLVLKQTAGNVTLELQADDAPNEFVSAYYTTPGQWQRLVFPFFRTKAIQRILVEIHTENTGSFSDQTMYWDDLEAFYVPKTPATEPCVLYDGESIVPTWTEFGSVVPRLNEKNPEKEGINTSEHCVAVNWEAGNQSWGGAWLNLDRRLPLLIDPTVYNRLSLLVKKPYNSDVELHLIKTGSPDQHVRTAYTGNGQWQRLVFNLEGVNNAFTSIGLSIAQDDHEIETRGTMYWDDLTAYYEPVWFDLLPHGDTIVVYDGETINPEWSSLASTIRNDVVNPLRQGDNTSNHCVAIERVSEDSDNGGKPWSGGVLWGRNKVSIDPKFYNTLSFNILKQVAGPVSIELQAYGELNKLQLFAEYTTPGVWQKVTFYIPMSYVSVINNILVNPHWSLSGMFDKQTMYWDDVCFYNTPIAEYTYETFEASDGLLNYRKLEPQVVDSQKKYPLIIFLHGAGERGNDNDLQLRYGSELFAKHTAEYPAYVLFPQCVFPYFWAFEKWPEAGLEASTFPIEFAQGTMLGRVKELIDSYRNLPQIDTERIYICGLSMGAIATFDLAVRYPDIFAAAVPICGGVKIDRLDDQAKKIAWRIFHGDNDDVMPVSNSRTAYKRLQSLGADVEYIEFPGVYHDAWTYALKRDDFLPWLFSKRKNMPTAIQTTEKNDNTGHNIFYRIDGTIVKDGDSVNKPLIKGIYISIGSDHGRKVFVR